MRSEAIALDRALSRAGEDIVFRRLVANAASIEFPARAHVRGYRPEELVGGISQTDSLVVMSPRELTDVGLDPLPRKGDKVVIGGRLRQVEAVGVFRIGSDLVRIEMRVVG